ncbi:glutamate--tRNA ligase [Candidatus Saccharibacteria bacterium]|nr:glutamate--tRNA ligase [Candidatus Saccharibacteria bacterium]
MNQKIKTRFAPSPTGFLHVGGVRTALFAWLVAQQNNGEFILRIEDTDQAREVEGSAQHIQDCLDWLGINWDEGPFYQSQRLDIYKEYAQKLIDSGRAYADPYTPQQVQEFREQAIKEKKPFLYRNHRPDKTAAWDGKSPLRFRSDPKAYSWKDEIMGDLSTGAEVIDDFILIKSDGFPTYNFAHIVDDNEMKISHVIRGQEFLASMPNYLNLYEAFDLNRPYFATIPHIMNEQGNKKLSKRDGAKDILDYKKEGYLPEALVNFLATLGWNDGTEQEVFSISELKEKFSLDRVGRSGARFDERRLLWINGSHIRGLKLEDLYQKVEGYWPEEAKDHDKSYKKQVLGLVQERLKYFAELPELTRFFFTDLALNPELISTHKQLKKYESGQLKDLLQKAKASLETTDFSAEQIQEALNKLLQETGEKPAVLFSLIRIATTQAPASPELAGSLSVLGKETSLIRIGTQIERL